jgi:hypothetical protein
MEVRIVTVSDRETGQDAVISPLLVNIYLLLRARADGATRTLDVFRHHVIDLWWRTVRRRSQKDRITRPG